MASSSLQNLTLLVASAAALTLSLPTTTAAQDVSVTADLSGQTATQTFPMLECVGSSHMEMGMWAVWRDHLHNVQRDIGFKHLRGHGLLDDDMSTYLGGGANMYNAFSIWNYLLDQNMKPIVELSFMPSDLAADKTKTFMHYDAIISPPASLTAWGAFITDLVKLTVNQYGIDEVRQWRFEVWNEFNCGFFSGNETQYFELYQATANAIKSVDPLIQVGGPATCQCGQIPEFLNFVNTNNVPMDFVSSHLYPTDSQPAPTTDGWMEYLAVAAANITAMAKPNTPFVLTEFNSGLGINTEDTPYAAAFMLHNHLALQAIPLIDTASYWAFTDIFEESGMDSRPWHQGYGLQTIYGVPKPIYRAFEMLSQLPSETVPVSSSGSSNGNHRDNLEVKVRPTSITVGTVDVVVAIDTSLHPTIAVTALVLNHALYNTTITTQTVSVTFKGIPANAIVASQATVDVIDETHANAYPTWVAYGSPTYPNATEIAAEMLASQLVGVSTPLTASSGQVSLHLVCQPESITRIRFEYSV